MGFWRDVFDLSEAADTPARATATMQVGATLLALGVLAAIIYGVTTGWQGPFLAALLILPMAGISLLVNSRLARKRARARARARRNRRSPRKR